MSNEELLEAAVQLLARAPFLPENGNLYPKDIAAAALVLLGQNLYDAANTRIADIVRGAGRPT